MSDHSRIEWTDSSWNPIVGCSHASPGCDNCYAEKMAFRLSHSLGAVGTGENMDAWVAYSKVIADRRWNGKTALIQSALEKPLHWKRGRKIFVCSMGDLFHESVPDEWIDRVFAVAAMCPQHTFQILTKRPERMLEYWTVGNDAPKYKRNSSIANLAMDLVSHWKLQKPFDCTGFPLKNVWLGVTAENQEQADKRIPILLQCPAAVRFVSIEPMLGLVDLTRIPQGDEEELDALRGNINATCQHRAIVPGKWRRLDWVIVGGESGPGARPMDLDWARSVRDQCAAAKVPFFFKGWGTFDAKKSAPSYRRLEGREWNEFPEGK